MATARVEPIPQEPPPRKVILELSEEEWAALYTLSAKFVEGPLARLYYDLLPLEEEGFWWDSEDYWDWTIWRSGSAPLPRLK
jgi:hypothetical protein